VFGGEGCHPPADAAHMFPRATEHDRPPLLLSVPAAAAALGIGRATIYELIAAGELGSLKVGARRLVPAAEVDRFIAAKLAETRGA
jgi:excisionase family DNA binding protein